MKLHLYVKDKSLEFLIGFSAVGVCVLFFRVFDVPMELRFVVTAIFVSCLFFVFFHDFFRKRKFYNEIQQNLERLDKKYLFLETIQQPDFYEGEILCGILYDVDKSMCENVNEYRCKMNDFKDYIEMWVHDVKIPLASLQLMCHNHKSLDNKKIGKQIRRLDRYMDQILYYVRSEHKENDYLIQEVELQKCITEAALKNREEILTYEIQLEVDNVEESVMTDSKWMIFILNQLVNNCIKYRDKKKKSRIRFFMEVFPNCQVLHVWDNGIGIPSSDLPKVFDKSFTGKNGRLIHGNSYAESTGMGLYIVKQLCDSLGHRVELVSEEGMYTEVRITFAKNDYFDVRNGSNVTKL